MLSQGVQFGSEMAAPFQIEDASWHRSNGSIEECGWKRGDSAMVIQVYGKNAYAPPVGRRSAFYAITKQNN
jgi:hypothetical protein